MNGMNRWQAMLSACILGFGVVGGCSKTATHEEPSGQAGAAAGGGAAGLAGASVSAGTSSQAGGPQGGGGAAASAGTGQGGTPSAGSGGETAGGETAGGETAGGASGAPSSGPIQAVMGRLCPVESTIGVVELAGFPAPYVQVALYDSPDPWIGEPELSTPTCAYHHYEPGACPDCEADEVCSLASACVPERRTIKDATLRVSASGAEREYKSDTKRGGIYSTLDIGNAAAAYAMTLTWGDLEVQLAPMAVASKELANAEIRIEGTSEAPGALDAVWTASQEGAFVRSRIPINHHAGGPTFTECAAPESAGSFHADAAMINPLAVVTGLEFQGLRREFVAAAETIEGCVEFRFGEQLSIFPN